MDKVVSEHQNAYTKNKPLVCWVLHGLVEDLCCYVYLELFFLLITFPNMNPVIQKTTMSYCLRKM